MISHDNFCVLGAPNAHLHQLEALDLLIEMAENSATLIPGGASEFVEKVFLYLWTSPNGHMLDLAQVMAGSSASAFKTRKVTLIRKNLLRESVFFWVAAAWAVHCLRESTEEDAGRYCMQVAQRLFGAYLGSQFSRQETIPLAKISTLGSDARQKDNRANRDHVFAWADKHIDSYPSLNKAALAIYESHQVSAELKTIRNWLTQWKRERKVQQVPD